MVMNPQHYLSTKSRSVARQAFTLVEVLVSMTVLLILLLISAQVIGTVQSTWTASNARVGQFREARTAFDIITRNLSQATLNTYVDYDQSYLTDSTALSTTAPSQYLRKSDLRFVTGEAATLLQSGGGGAMAPGHAVFFQAPLGVSHTADYVGLDRLLCGRGYFVQYTSDEFFRPIVLKAGLPRYRYRLMEFSPPAEKNLIYAAASATPNNNAVAGSEWFSEAGVLTTAEDDNDTQRGLTRPIADNIVALIIAPQLENGAAANNPSEAFNLTFQYDSAVASGGAGQGNQHRLPSLVKVVLVAIDERTAEQLSQRGDPSTPPFGTEISGLLTPGSDQINLNRKLEDIAKVLRDKRINYRIFSATVSLRGAKWSS